MKKELTAFLKNRAKQMESDFVDVPKWVIEACVDFIEERKPTRLQKAYDNAGHYLSDSDLTTEEQVDLIAKHEDINELIDNIEGVTVWQPLEGSMTVQRFLESIQY